ncbi:MAG: methylenetetrahydrofolate reductase, partial [Frankiales bacterium]|nr:methylenetetrahydrofolate reductase [Frankiales bacterium]
MSAERETGCPKQMVYGPCGGVRPGGLCEMAPTPCPFALLEEPIDFQASEANVTAALNSAAPAHRRTSELLTIAQQRPAILTDFTVPAFDVATLREVTRILADSCDAVLVGEHQNRPDFPPTLMAELIADA